MIMPIWVQHSGWGVRGRSAIRRP